MGWSEMASEPIRTCLGHRSEDTKNWARRLHPELVKTGSPVSLEHTLEGPSRRHMFAMMPAKCGRTSMMSPGYPYGRTRPLETCPRCNLPAHLVHMPQSSLHKLADSKSAKLCKLS